MALKPLMTIAAAAAASLLAVMPFDPALAGGSKGGGTVASGPHCKPSGGGGVIINKPVTVNNNVNIYKPVTINKSVDIWNTVNIQKNIDIQNNVQINKSINIEKNITINNNSSASATATASAAASATSRSFGTGTSTSGATYYGSYSEETVNYGGGGSIGSVNASEACEEQEATVVKAVRAICVTAEGREFPATHMAPDTFIESSYEGEIARCIPGAHLKLIIGEVVQSDQGMAGTFEHGAVLLCGDHEAVRHYKGGMLKCEAVTPVKDCTERTNLRKYGTGDMFFSFRTRVCATSASASVAHAVELTGMTLEGGVGEGH